MTRAAPYFNRPPRNWQERLAYDMATRFARYATRLQRMHDDRVTQRRAVPVVLDERFKELR